MTEQSGRYRIRMLIRMSKNNKLWQAELKPLIIGTLPPFDDVKKVIKNNFMDNT